MQALAFEGLPLNQKEELRIAQMNHKKTATVRQKNPYDVNEMIKNDTSIPVIVGGGAFANCPEYRDPRLNLEYTLFIKNKIDGEKFWVKYISGNNEANSQLTEVRWDLFEDAMLSYLQQTLTFNGEELSSINWHVFFGILNQQLSHTEDEHTICPLFPMSPSFVSQPSSYLYYQGLKVAKQDWVSFIKDIGFKDYAKRCMMENAATATTDETRFHAKLTQMKSSKRGIVVYEDGTVYEGAREGGRPSGKGTIKYGGRRGTYDGDFVSGRRHGYGVE